MNNGTANQQLRHRKAEIKAQIARKRALIRQDFQELKEDLNPFRAAGQMVKNMLQPGDDGQMTNSGVLNFGIDTGISMLINRFIPGGRNAARVIAPVLMKNLATHVVPQAREKAEQFLRWVAEKTEDDDKPEPPAKKVRKKGNIAKKTATRFLRWVADKTDKKEDEDIGTGSETPIHPASNGKVQTYYGPVSG